MRVSTVLMVGAVLAWNSVAAAYVTDSNCVNDGDGVIDCPATQLAVDPGESGTYYTTIVGNQLLFAPGHMKGWFNTSDATDPTIRYLNAIDNETTTPWTGYRINYTLDSLSQITGGSLVFVEVSLPDDWTGGVTQQIGSPIGTVVHDDLQTYYRYFGQIEMAGSTPVEYGDTLAFEYKLQGLTGATRYTYIQEMIPVPEPSTFVLLSLGAVGLLAYARRRRG